MRDDRAMNDGARPRLLLLHGFLVRRSVWDALAAELSHDAEVIAPDLPGYGRQGRGMRSYQLDDVVDALLPVVEQEQPTHILGHSMGGIVAMALAVRRPGQFERVGVAGLPVYRSRAEGLAHVRRRGRVRDILLRQHQLTHAGCVAIHRTRRMWLPVASRMTWRHADMMVSGGFHHTFESHAEAIEAIIFAGHVEGLAERIHVPVEALHGERDGAAPIGPVRAVAERFGWRLRVAPTGRHEVALSRPHMTAAWVRANLFEPVTPAT